MTRYADPHRCPDCRGPIAGQDACPHCGLTLRGEVAQRLFTTLTTADALLGSLRAASASLPAAEPQAPPAPAVRRSGGLSAASVPKILLGLGAICVLVAALVFLAVTWSSMGVGARTATLVGFTIVTALLAVWMTRRELRGAAEALSLVALGLLTLDVFGADNAGWLGDLNTSAFLVVLGAGLTAAGTTAALLARRTPIGVLTGVEVVAGLGVGLVAAGVASTDRIPGAPALVLAVLTAGLATVGALQLELRILTLGSGLVTGLSWFGLAGTGLERALRHDSLRELWLELHAWPLVVAALFAGLLGFVRPLPPAARVMAGMVGYAVLAAAVLAPAVAAEPTMSAYAVGGALAVNGVLTWIGRRPWGLVPAMSTGFLALWLLGLALPVAGVAGSRLADVAETGWAGQALDGLPPQDVSPFLAAPWLPPVAVIVLVGSVVALGHAEPRVDRVVGRVADLRVGVALTAAAAIGTVASYPLPVWLVPSALLAVGAGFLAWWLRRQSVMAAVLAAGFLLGAVAIGWYDEWLTAAALVPTLGAALVVQLRARGSEVGAVAGAVASATLAGLAWTVGALLDVSQPWAALGGLLILALTVLPLHLLPARWWACPSPALARAGIEVGAAVAAVPLGLAGALLAAPGSVATWTSVYLTVAGAAVTVLALLRTDRRPVGWVGGGLLALASWVRLWDIGVREPEPYTLPGAAALAVVGVWSLRRRPDIGTMTALGPALGLATVPSLLWALTEPPGLRALLLGLGCLGLVLLGTRLRWTAPVVFGASVGALLVLRLAAPYVDDAVPRWLLIGAAGALLIAVGVTWESRLREARQVVGYVRGLR